MLSLIKCCQQDLIKQAIHSTYYFVYYLFYLNALYCYFFNYANYLLITHFYYLCFPYQKCIII